MALIEVISGNTADSKAGVQVPADVRVADPFTPANLTLVEATAGIAEDWTGFWITTWEDAQGVVIVTTGAAGSETRIAALPINQVSVALQFVSIYVPIPVASGTRIAVGVSAHSTATVAIQIAGIPSANFAAEPSFTVMDCGPFDLQNDSGTYGRGPQVDPGGTANTKGSWTEISNTATNGSNNVLNGDSLAQAYDHFGFLLAETRTFQADHDRLWDLGTGAAASEVAYVANYNQRVLAVEATSCLQPVMHPWDKASTTRVAARMQASTTDATDRIGTILLFGVR